MLMTPKCKNNKILALFCLYIGAVNLPSFESRPFQKDSFQMKRGRIFEFILM